MVSFFRMIIQHNPCIEVLTMWGFSNEKVNENIGEIVLETLLSSNIDSITDLNLSSNYSWFKILGNKKQGYRTDKDYQWNMSNMDGSVRENVQDRSSNVDLLV